MQSIVFELNNDFIELCNLLKIVGIADSGGHGKMMVAEGLILVDDKLELRKTAKIRANQCVKIGEQLIEIKQGELKPTKSQVKSHKLSNNSPFQLKSSHNKSHNKTHKKL